MRRKLLLFVLLLLLATVFTSCINFSDSTVPTTTEAPTNDLTSTLPDTTVTTTPEATTTRKPALTTSPEPTSDPYLNVTKDAFYKNYTKATSRQDALYRSAHGLMSGSIDAQDQKPTVSAYQPQEKGVYYRNTSALYSDDKNTYYIVDAYGDVVNIIFKGGAYVTLEEVAAYVYAFGEIPANYVNNKKTSPTSSIWGEYLRLNHSKFSGDTSKYPYEPELPNISGCGGKFYYYEIDIGTTGTDCDPDYAAVLYNNGTKITRGAARIVYSYSDLNGNKIIDTNEKFVFYTYNHYNDFQEYLNYEGGWGKMFGNITGGGTISSKYNYNPTPYVATLRKDFTQATVSVVIVLPHYIQTKHLYFI